MSGQATQNVTAYSRLTSTTALAFSSDEVRSLSDEEVQRLFAEMAGKNDFRLVKQGFRAFSANLLARGLIEMKDYAGIFGGQAVYQLTVDSDGRFVHVHGGGSAEALAKRYSLAKYGSVDDILFFADTVIAALEAALDDPSSAWRTMFETAMTNGDQVVMMTTGWRNVPSTANVMYDIVVEQLNVKLAHYHLPTIVNVKLPRIAPPCENYASLSVEERENVSAIHDHILPDKNFYKRPGVHVIFGDDVLVTGATADKVYSEAMRNGARSFMAIYPMLVDPILALKAPDTEETLNTREVTGRLDDKFASVLGSPGYTPILRSLRALLNAESRGDLLGFLPKVPLKNLVRLYIAALNNNFLSEARSAPSLYILRQYLIEAGTLDEQGYCRQGLRT